MDGLDQLDQFHLSAHGDLNEREFWPLLSSRFPSYQVLWRRLIVPLTCRIDPRTSPDRSIRLRAEIPEALEKISMFHYSVFYFLGRAVKRFEKEDAALEYPEDVFYLLDSIADNFKLFRRAMHALAADCGREIFRAAIDQSPPFRRLALIATLSSIIRPSAEESGSERPASRNGGPASLCRRWSGSSNHGGLRNNCHPTT